jgi:hypothetical protein
MRADCALRAGYIERAVGDLSRLMRLRSSTIPLEHLTIFRLSYFFLPPPLYPSQNSAPAALKQCLRLNRDSSFCLPARRQLKALGFAKVETMMGSGEWRDLLDFFVGEGHDWDGQICLFEDVRRGPREIYITHPISITDDLVPSISALPFESPTNAFPAPHRPFTAPLRISYTPLPPASGACVLRAAIETGQEYNG